MTGARPQDGLTSAEAATRLAELGPNEVPSAPPVPLARRVLAQLTDPMILLLIGAFVVVLVLGDVADGVIIAAVVVLNTAIGVVQEVRAENAISALERVSAPRARVRRDGRWEELSSRLVAVDDVVRLEAGDVVPADLRLFEAVSLEVDEASMTGESLPVSRRAGDELLSGTVVTHGRGTGVVVRTGAQSGLGRIAALIAQTRLRPTPLQQRIARLSRQLVTVTAGLALLVVVLGLVRGDRIADALILAVSLGVAAVPESLPAVVSVALAMGAHRMAKRSALVRWLPAVETLGSVSVLASDKTGTLTEGRMTVQRAWTPLGMSTVSGRGYEVAGDIEGPSAGQAARLMRDLALCNEARIFRDGPDDWRIVGDPMEAALLVAAAKGGVEQPTLRDSWTRVDEVPFDSESQRMTTVDRHEDGRLLEVVKGAPEVVLDLVAGSPDVHEARRVAHELADGGYRILAVVDRLQCARDEVSDGVASEDAVVHELVGLVGIVDPLRAEAAGVVSACHDAGIRTILITGDHPATARAIAVEVGIATDGAQVVSGDAVARGEHVEQVESIAVYARTRPEQKVDIIDALQARGHVVAMTGDGVNDAPALRRADLGVAMGDRGTEVARQAADLVLADDQLRTVVHAVEEGRRIYSNIRGFLRYALAGGLAEVAVILLGPFVGLGFPLAPAQILWINMLTHGVPGVAFGSEPLDRSTMHRPSPSPERSVLGDGLVRQILVAGALIGAVSLAAGLLAASREQSVQTWVFLTLGLAQLGLALALRAPRRGLGWRSRGLEAAVLAAVALQLAAVMWSPLQDLLGTQAVATGDLVLLTLLAVVPGAVTAIQQAVGRRVSGSVG